MKNTMKLLLAFALLLILLFSFSGNALAREDGALMPDACGHKRFYQIRSYYVYTANLNSCLKYYRIVCKCRDCGHSWNEDTLVDSVPHEQVPRDRGHGGSRHYYRYECQHCRAVLTADIPYTCYGPPCTALTDGSLNQIR